MSNWNKNSIADERRALAETELTNYSREQLVDRIVELETALYPLVYVLGSLNESSWRGTTATSKLFPLKNNDKFLVWQPGTDGNSGTSIEVESIPESELHATDYFEHDSIVINDGSHLDDDFEVIAVHQEAPGAYVGCGSISMGDIRYASKLIFPVTNGTVDIPNLPREEKFTFEERRALLLGIADEMELMGDLRMTPAQACNFARRIRGTVDYRKANLSND